MAKLVSRALPFNVVVSSKASSRKKPDSHQAFLVSSHNRITFNQSAVMALFVF
jgi:hypothetical protein